MHVHIFHLHTPDYCLRMQVMTEYALAWLALDCGLALA